MDVRPKAAALAALALAAASLLVACGSDGGSDATTADGSTTSATAGATTTTEATDVSDTTATTADDETTTTDGSDSSEGRDTETTELDTLSDGDHYVFMAGLEAGQVEGQDVQVLIVDPVEMLTGQAAIDAAAADGVTLDTDYYIRNVDQTVKRIAVVPEASVTSLRDGSADPVPSSVDEVWQQEHLFRINVGNVRAITTISGIEAVYLP